MRAHVLSQEGSAIGCIGGKFQVVHASLQLHVGALDFSPEKQRPQVYFCGIFWLMRHLVYRLNRVSTRKFWYYFLNASSHFPARTTKDGRAEAILKRKSDQRRMQDVFSRLSYYNSVSEKFDPSKNAVEHSKFLLKSSTSTIVNKGCEIGSTYFYDLVDLMDYFGPGYSFDYDCGDVIAEPNHPTFVKSHPIKNNSHSGILLKLDAIRHFLLTRDPIHFHDKKPMAVFRGPCHQEHRRTLVG